MKILLREYENERYVWKDAEYTSYGFVCNDEIVCETNIITVKDDNRKDYVICAHCGSIIKNTAEAIEAHFAEQEAKRDCFKCGSLRKYNVNTSKAEFTKNMDGSYVVTETYTAGLRCGQNWYNGPAIDSEDAKKICLYYRCRRHGVQSIADIFTKYPDPFDKHITVDMLNDKNFPYECMANRCFEYDLKCRSTVKACVNELGIVDHFIIKHRSRGYIAYYSAKYDKLFFTIDGRHYEDSIPSGISETKFNQAYAKISAIYKEEESK
jgi:hypothetical protein